MPRGIYPRKNGNNGTVKKTAAKKAAAKKPVGRPPTKKAPAKKPATLGKKPQVKVEIKIEDDKPAEEALAKSIFDRREELEAEGFQPAMVKATMLPDEPVNMMAGPPPEPVYDTRDREEEICLYWANALSSSAMAFQLRRLADDPRGWKKAQRRAIILAAADRIAR